jgi:predicted aminopeptidase
MCWLTLLALLSACSPVYVYKSAAGHAKLLWRRKSIEKALKDPKTPPELREKLLLVMDARSFAFETLHLKKSADYSSYAKVDQPYLTYLLSASERLRFEPYVWSFPFAGSFPYKGHFREKDALREKEQLESRGYDAYVRGVSAYNAPVFANPITTTALEKNGPGELSELIIHELAHGTVYFKNNTDFDEGVASFIGDEGAAEFLSARFGPESKELADFRRSREEQAAYDKRMDETYAALDALYTSSSTAEQKLHRRAELFEEERGRFEALGFRVKALNNAVILAHRVYREDVGLYRRAFESTGRDWAKTIALFKALDRKDPAGDLRRRLAAP